MTNADKGAPYDDDERARVRYENAKLAQPHGASAMTDQAREKAVVLLAAISPRFALIRKHDEAYRERELQLVIFALTAAFEAGVRQGRRDLLAALREGA